MKRLIRHWDVILSMVLAAVFVLFPEIDLRVSTLFYRPDEGFFWQDRPLPMLVFRYAPIFTNVFASGLGLLLLLGLMPRFSRLKRYRKHIAYLGLVLALGPGLMVNSLLKDHWGRARPSHIHEFGGEQIFTPAFFMSNQCRDNCSFVSGHASLGFYYCALGFLSRCYRRFWFGMGIGLGTLVGAVRIIQGRHFLSDVVFSFFVVYFCAKLLHYLLFSRTSPIHRLSLAR